MILAHRAAMLLFAVSAATHAQPTIPSEFDAPGSSLDRLFALGGVGSFQVSQSIETIYEGGSYQLDIAFNSSGIFMFSSVGLGVLNSGVGAFNTDPGGDTFSITVRAPDPAVGDLELTVTLRDDDNDDGNIDAGEDDDEWISPPIEIAPGVAVYNIDLSLFEDFNPGVGNDLPDFANGPVGAMLLTFQTSTSLPGGRIEVPITLWIDHAGVYFGNQTLPGGGCLADTNGDGVLSPADFSAWVSAFNTMAPACDQNGDGACSPADFSAWVANYNVGC
ncbi:MAG: hypothetical protein KDA31_07035 [Phycisphaerales bacterium]|nr:hypothetical protein [Phycisphaerales bacterium]MCB9837153.1 hypothetical protein [Phycisphaera sp.]